MAFLTEYMSDNLIKIAALKHLIRDKKINEAIECLKQNEALPQELIKSEISLHALVDIVVNDVPTQELWSLWEMETDLYNSHIQWLPRETLEDTIELLKNTTPLFYSYCELFTLLLQYGADVNKQNKYGNTPLQSAVGNNHKLMVRLLLKYGANVHVQNKYGETLLHEAAKSNNESIISLLLQRSSKEDINLQHNSLEETALYWAVCHENESMAHLLLQYGATCDRVSLGKAIEKGNESITRLLLEKNTDVNMQDKWGDTPLHWAVIHNKESIVRLLLEKNADANVRGFEGQTPLQLAESRGNQSIITLLSAAEKKQQPVPNPVISSNPNLSYSSLRSSQQSAVAPASASNSNFSSSSDISSNLNLIYRPLRSNQQPLPALSSANDSQGEQSSEGIPKLGG